MIRVRIFYAKTAILRYTSNLDVQRIWERMLRRACLPLAYTQGFHPQPRINLACPLPLGMTSNAEIIDLWLEDDLTIDAIQLALTTTSHPGMVINQIELVALNAPALQPMVLSADYCAEISEDISPNDLDTRICALLDAPTLPRVRRDKPYDLRPLIFTLKRTSSTSSEKIVVEMNLSVRDGATGRPDEVLSALNIDPLNAKFERTTLYLNINSTK